jgi:hypothetical protein
VIGWCSGDDLIQPGIVSTGTYTLETNVNGNTSSAILEEVGNHRSAECHGSYHPAVLFAFCYFVLPCFAADRN